MFVVFALFWKSKAFVFEGFSVVPMLLFLKFFSFPISGFVLHNFWCKSGIFNAAQFQGLSRAK